MELSALFMFLPFMFLGLMLQPFVAYGQDPVTQTDYEIYSQSLIDLNYVVENEPFLLVKEASNFGNTSSYNDMFGYYKSVSTIAKKDVSLPLNFDKLPEEKFLLEEQRFAKELNLLSLHEAEVDVINLRVGWENLRKQYSNFAGIVQFTKVAYNDKRIRSLHFVSFAKSKNWVDGFFISYSLKDDSLAFAEKVKVFHLRPETLSKSK